MDWTWRLDGIVPSVLEAGTLMGVLAVLLAWLAGGLWLLRWPAARVALQLALALSLGMALSGFWDEAVLAAGLTLAASLVAGAIGAIAAVRRRVGSPVVRAAAAAALVLVWDGTYSAVSLDWPALILAIATVGGLVLTAGSAVLRRRSSARAQLGVAAVWLVVSIGVGGWSRFNLRLAERRASAVIDACRRFESDRRRLPASLEELVPGYLPRVPRANWTILGHFVYEAERGALSYLDPWPFEQTYVFSADRWDWHRLVGGETRRVDSSPESSEPLDS